MINIFLQKKILAGFVINALVIVLFWQVAQRRIDNHERLRKSEMRRNEISERLGRVRSDVNRFGTSIKNYAITGNEKFLQYLNSESVYSNVLYLKRAFSNDSVQLKRMADLELIIQERIESNFSILESIKNSDQLQAKRLIDQSLLQINSTLRLLALIEEEEENRVRKNNQTIQHSEQRLRLIYQVSFVVSLLLLITVFVIIHYHLRARKNSEFLLSTNKQLLQSIIDNTSSIIFVKHINGEYLLANKQFKKIFQPKDDQIVGRTDKEIFSQNFAERLRATDADVVKAEKELVFEEIIPHSGENHIYSLTKFPLWDAAGKIYAIAGMAADISGQKNEGALLQQSIAQFESLFDAAPDAIVVINSESRIIKWNPMAELLFGYTSEEAIGRSLPELIIPVKQREHYADVIDNFTKSHTSGNNNLSSEMRAMHRNKNEFDIEISLSHTIHQEQPLVIAFISDITRRTQMEKENTQTRNFLDSIIENIPDMIFVKDAKELRFVRFNKAGETLLGAKREDLIGKNDHDLFPKEDADFFISKDREVLDEKKMMDIQEEKINTPSGERWLHTKKIPILDESGNAIYLLGISADITERKRLENERLEAEKQLRTSEIQLGLILENIGEGVVVTDTRQRVVLSNRMAEEILATDNNSRSTNWAKRYEIYYPDGETVFPAQDLPIEKALRGSDTEDTEIILHDPSSNVSKLVQVTGHPIRDEGNRVIAAVATIKDITKYKELEKALEESEIKYRRLIGFRRDQNET